MQTNEQQRGELLAEFEALASEHGYTALSLARAEDGYVDDSLNFALECWIASRSAALAKVAELEKDAGRFEAMIKHEWRLGWNREGDACRVWHFVDGEPGEYEPVCGWPTHFDDPRAAIDAAMQAKEPKA